MWWRYRERPARKKGLRLQIVSVALRDWRTPVHLGVQMVLQIDNVLSLNLDARPSPNRGEFAIDPEEASGNDDGTLVCTRVSRGRFVGNGRIRSTSRDRPPLCDGYCSAQRIG